MIFRLFRRDPQAASIAALYGAIVAQARHPGFYLEYGVPDTPEGRFDMIVLHLALVCRRLGRAQRSDQAAARVVSQAVFDMFCRDMDHNLRELGVSDLGVPKKMQKLGEAFYGRLDAYDRALAEAGEDALAAALRRNVLGEGTLGPAAPRMAAYVRAAAERLEVSATADLCAGKVGFPDPVAPAVQLSEVQG